MDSNKPRVSISAARVAAPGAYLYARSLSASSSTGSVPIRAPLTLDDDDDEETGSDFESNSRRSLDSDSSSSNSNEVESETEEGFESASSDPDEETAGKSAVLGWNRVYRPFVGDPDEETSENYSSLGDEESEDRTDLDEDSPNPRIAIPRAKLSMDDDEVDQILGSEGEDNGLSVLVKVHSTEAGPRIKCMGVEGREDESSELGETSFIDKPEFSGELVSVEEETMDKTDSDNGSVSMESVEEKSLDITQEVCCESPVRSEVVLGEEGLGLETAVEDFTEEQPMVGKSGDLMVQQYSSNLGDGSENEFDAMMKPVEGFVAPGNEEGENAGGQMRGCQIDSGGSILNETEKLESNTEPKIDFEDSEVSQLDSTWDSLCMGNSEMFGTADVTVSDTCPMEFVGSSSSLDPKVKLDSESEAVQDSGKIEERLLLSNGGVSSLTSGNSVEMTDGITKIGEQVSELKYSLVVSESESDGNRDSGMIGKRLSLYDEDIYDSCFGNPVEMTSEEMENEEQIAQLVHNHVLEADEDGEISGRGEEYSDSAAEPSGSEESVTEEHFMDDLSEEKKANIEKMRLIRVKFLRLVKRLGFSPDDSVVAEVLHKLALFPRKHKTIHGFGLESDKTKALQLEKEGKDDIDFSLNILVLGKIGVGKSATVNSIFGEIKSPIGAFKPTTSSIKEIDGSVDGVKIRVLDTPGLRPSVTEEKINQRILYSIKKRMRKLPADIILYIDRLDEYSGNFSDIQMLRTITSSLGSSIWQKANVVLTHAASVALDSSHEVFVARRSFLVLQEIGRSVGQSGFANSCVMPKVVIAENNQKLLQKNKTGECEFLNWRRRLLLVCCSVKILSEASSLLKPENYIDETKLFSSRVDSVSLFYTLWNVLQSRAYRRLSSRQTGDNFESYNDFEVKKTYISDYGNENLGKEPKNAYFKEYEFLVKKQQKDEVKSSREMKQNTEHAKNNNLYDQEETGFADGRNLAAGKCLPAAFGFGVKRGKNRFGIYLDSSCYIDNLKALESSRMFIGVGMNKEGKGQISFRASGLEQMQIAVFGVLPIVLSMFRSFNGG